jgi:hypothetical protein
MTKPSTAFKKGEKRPNQGKRGPNKVTKELKEMILQALDNAGGVEYLEQRANDPKTASAFLTLVGKVLPMTVQGPGPDGEHGVSVKVSFVGGNPTT